MIVHVERINPNGTITNFCVSAIDKNEAMLKIKDLREDNVENVYNIKGYEYTEGIFTSVGDEK